MSKKRAAEESMQQVGTMLRQAMPRGIGFALFVFNIGPSDKGFMSYTSNAVRKDMIKAMREWLSHVED